MYNNQYLSQYNPAPSVDRINAQINELQKMKEQLQHPIQPTPTNLTQNFQIAPTNREIIKYATSIDEVERDMVMGDTPYFSKDMSVVWIKNTKGEITTYELTEIKPLDEKDMQIQYLQQQIEELKGRIDNEQHDSNDDPRFNESSTTEDNKSTGTATKKNKPTSISKVSGSKKK